MKNQLRQNQFLHVLLISVMFLLLVFLMLTVKLWENQLQPAVFRDRNLLSYQHQDYLPRPKLESFLVIGLNTFSDQQEANISSQYAPSDFLLLIVLDHAAQRCSAIQLDCNTVANIDILGKNSRRVAVVRQPLALAHSYGKNEHKRCQNTQWAVSDLLHGVRIDHYISATLDTIPILTDLIGPIEVTVQDDLSAVSPALIQGQTVLLDSDLALNYIQPHTSDNAVSDSKRSERQLQYADALIRTLSRKLNHQPRLASDLMSDLSRHTASDLTVYQLVHFLDQLKSYSFDGITALEGELIEKDHVQEFYPHDDFLMKTVLRLFYRPVSKPN